MSEQLVKKIRLIFPLLMLLSGLGYARYDSYQLDGDAVCFLDMAHGLLHHKAYLAINGCWFPGYSVALAIGTWIMRPTIWHELQVDYYVNLVIFALAIAAITHFTSSLLKYRDKLHPETAFALSRDGLLLFAYTIVFYAWQREQSLAKVRSDALLCVFFILAGSFAVRLLTAERWRDALALGIALGCAFLTKSFGFVAALALFGMLFLFGLRQYRAAGSKLLTRLSVSIVVFGLVTAPYIAAISHQRDRFTFGEAGGLNYSWFIDGVQNIHQAYIGSTGHATLQLKHPERLLMRSPFIFAYDQHLNGTYPLWFDVSYWHDRTITHFYLPGEIHTILHESKFALRYLTEHPEPLVLLLLLFGLGYRLPRKRSGWEPLLILIGWGVLMCATYVLVLFSDRYVTGAYLLVLIPLFALLESRRKDETFPNLALALVILLAGLSLANAANDIGDKRRSFPLDWPSAQRVGAYDPDIYPAAHGIIHMGVQPGDRVACIGLACENPYWAYLAQAQIVAEVMDESSGPPATENPAVLGHLRGLGAKLIVAPFSATDKVPAGWQQLGEGRLYAFPL